jgi:hypothetical protein
MKRIFASVSHALWRMTAPVRRPLMMRFDSRVSRLVSGAINDRIIPPITEALADSGRRLERIEESLGRADLTASNMVEEIDMVLNGLSREIFRLQAQVEKLQRSLGEDGRASGNRLSIVAESDDVAPSRLGVG